MLAAFRIGADRERFGFDDEMNQPIIKDVRRLAGSNADNSAANRGTSTWSASCSTWEEHDAASNVLGQQHQHATSSHTSQRMDGCGVPGVEPCRCVPDPCRRGRGAPPLAVVLVEPT